MPAFCKISRASLCFESVTMPDPYQKCNRVATIIRLNEKIMLVNSIYVINSVKTTGMNPNASFGNISQQAAGEFDLQASVHSVSETWVSLQ
jgi:hypothetical protein